MANVRVVDVGSPEALQSKSLLLDCFDVDLNDQGAVDHFVGYVDSAGLIVVADHPDQTESIGGVALLSADANPGDFRIDFIGVAKNARRQGLASTLIKFCEIRATELGGLRVLIESSNGNSHKLYLQNGYLTTSLPDEITADNHIAFFKDL